MKSSPEDSPSWNGTNTSGFSGLAGGFRHSAGYFDLGDSGWFWSASTSSVPSAWRYQLSGINNVSSLSDWNWRFGCSVRCLKNTEE